MARPLLLGHRGCRLSRRTGAPAENTIAAFDLCLEAGCDGFEFDLRLTSDRRLIVCHDPNLRGKPVAQNSYQQLSPSADVSPCLEDVLARFTDTAFLDIELKVAGVEEAVVDALHSEAPSRGFVISSFLPEVLERLHTIDASLPLGYIFDRTGEAQHSRTLPVTHVMPQHKLLTGALVGEFHAEGKRVMAWTVNSSDEMKRLDDWGVDALVSDDPALLCRVFGGSNS